ASRHPRDQCGWPAPGRLPQLRSGRLDPRSRRQHADADRADQGDSRRHDRTTLRAHRQHHLERGEGADRRPRAVQRRSQRADRIRRRARPQDGCPQRDHQQPAARNLRYRSPRWPDGGRRERRRHQRRGGAPAPPGGPAGGPVRRRDGVRPGLRLSLQRPGRLYHRPELPDRRRLLPRHLLSRIPMSKAIRIETTGGPEVMRLVEHDPGKPARGELRIRNRAIGVNYIDVYYRTGAYPMPLPGGIGMEAAGVVEEVGDDVSSFAPGDRVAYAAGPAGAYAEVHNMAAKSVLRLPDSVDDEAAAALMLKGMTVQYLFNRTVRLQ